MSTANEIRFLHYDHSQHRHLLPGYADLYKRIYALEPWNESKGCSQDRDGHPAVGLLEAETRTTCARCGHPLVDYWSTDEVIAEIEDLMTEGDGTVHFALDGEKVIGLTVGVILTLSQLEQRLKLAGVAERVATLMRISSLDSQVMYLQDIAVDPDYQRQGLARKLFLERLRVCADRHINHGVVRTMTQPRPANTYLWYTSPSMSFVEVARYNDDRGRVVLGKRLDDLFCLLGGPYVPPGDGK